MCLILHTYFSNHSHNSFKNLLTSIAGTPHQETQAANAQKASSDEYHGRNHQLPPTKIFIYNSKVWEHAADGRSWASRRCPTKRRQATGEWMKRCGGSWRAPGCMKKRGCAETFLKRLSTKMRCKGKARKRNSGWWRCKWCINSYLVL